MADGDEGGCVDDCVGEAAAPQKGLVRRLGGPLNSVRFSAELARRICRRLEAGETLREVCREPGMPHRSSVQAWARALPAFDRAMRRARRASGWHNRGGQRPKWCPHLAAEVCARVAEGEKLSSICADPDMPSMGLVFRWRKERPQFAADMALARRALAERFCDMGWEIAEAVTPANAFATHVKLLHLRWTAAAMAPARFGRFRAVEAEDAEAAAQAHEALELGDLSQVDPDVLGKALQRAKKVEVAFRVRHFEKVIGPDGKAYTREIPPEPKPADLTVGER